MQRKYELIIFDFDGVIADGMENRFQEIFEKSNEIAKELSLKEFANLEEFKTFAGLKLSDKLDYLDLHKKHYPKLFGKALKLVGNIFKESKLFEGIKPVIKELKNREIVLVIATKNRSWLVKAFLLKFRLKSSFKKVIGRGKSLDKSRNLEYLIHRFATKKSEVLFITDTINDVKDGKKVGIKTLAVTYGIDSEEDLRKEGADFIAQKPEDILQYIS